VKRPPVFQGGSIGFYLTDPAYVELHHLVVMKKTAGGLNIDDGDSYDTPAHHVILRNLAIRDIGPQGNHDGIKLSGVDDFQVEGCLIERWGDGGSGIDMAGCHRGTVMGWTFRNSEQGGASGMQVKGGSSAVVIQACRFEHAGRRAVNLGGNTDLVSFRPAPLGSEARDIMVENCIFLGAESPINFIGVDGAEVRHNTMLINVGAGTAPETFVLARNAWYRLDDPAHSRPSLPIHETDGIYGQDPRFQDAEHGDLRLQSGSPVSRTGAAPPSGTTAPSGRPSRPP
jgi:hypothetical protein